jgi:hypothetical protein
MSQDRDLEHQALVQQKAARDKVAWKSRIPARDILAPVSYACDGRLNGASGIEAGGTVLDSFQQAGSKVRGRDLFIEIAGQRGMLRRRRSRTDAE